MMLLLLSFAVAIYSFDYENVCCCKKLSFMQHVCFENWKSDLKVMRKDTWMVANVLQWHTNITSPNTHWCEEIEKILPSSSQILEMIETTKSMKNKEHTFLRHFWVCVCRVFDRLYVTTIGLKQELTNWVKNLNIFAND